MDPKNSDSGNRRLFLTAVSLLWLAGIGAGTTAFMNYERRPGDVHPQVVHWPLASALRPIYGQSTLVLIAHPKCPCSAASLDELADLVASSPGPIHGYVLFMRPSDLDPSWAHTGLWERARKIPGFQPVEDVNGREARLFGAATSGHVLAFDSQGVLRFSGGITGARGARGESAGKASLRALLTTGTTALARTTVFGCPLEDREGSEVR
jgi:hypothetical protein